jgi:hypothetical protein
LGSSCCIHSISESVTCWFIEGFDTPDLAGVKALLEELS